MFCKKCGGELDPVTKVCENCGVTPAGMPTLDFLSTFYRKIFVIVFWISLVGCIIGVGYWSYRGINFALDNAAAAFLGTLVTVVLCEALIILMFGTIAVFLNIQKGVDDLHGKTNALNDDVKKIGKILLQMHRDKTVNSVDGEKPE
jgi:thiol-disulfide isomerase/thioredoxin